MTMIDKFKEEAEKLSHELARERDELKLRAHLFSMETKDEWEKLEKKYHQFINKAPAAKETAGKAAEEVGRTLKAIGVEIKKGYQRIRDSL